MKTTTRRGLDSDGPGSATQFVGKIDEVRIYDRALEPEEVEADGQSGV